MRGTTTRTFGALALAIGLFGAFASPALADPPDRFEPPAVVTTLQAGQSTTVDKTLHLTGLPAKADIIVAIDATGSMGAGLARAQADAVQICTDVQAAIPGARFAAVEFEDYPFPPYGVATDDPYELRTPGYTSDCATFSAGVAAMVLGNGNDAPESNNRVHYEAYSDPVLLGTRDPEATRFLVMLADNVPHSVASFGACPSTAPFSDPGRNGINESGGGDDIETPDAIAGLNADDHTLLYISYNRTTAHPCHTSLANATGGVAVPESEAQDIGAFIIDQAAEVPYTVDLMVSAGCPIGFSFNPAPPYGPFTGESHVTFVETITAPPIVGNYTCTITAVMSPGGPTTAVQTVNVTVTPGPPATLVLTPPADTNTVDEQHCVTATVRDAFGNPTPGVTVRFQVTGPGATSGSAVTNASGEATFCYTSALPGGDVITAYADTNSNNVRDAGEPQGTAMKTWVLPASTEGCKVTQGGWIRTAAGNRANFGGNAHVPPKGHQNYVDHGTGMHISSLSVDAVACSADGTSASIFGKAKVDGAGSFDYRIDVRDLGEPGRADRFRIRLSNGYDSGDQQLRGGNVQIH